MKMTWKILSDDNNMYKDAIEEKIEGDMVQNENENRAATSRTTNSKEK